MKLNRLIVVLPLIAAGCTDGGSQALTRAPADWGQYANKTVTVQGTAGNSPRGPIVRLFEGGYIALKQREPWGFVNGYGIASRNVEVTGTLISGRGIRDEKYVLDVKSVTMMQPEDAKRRSGESAEP